MLKFKNTAKKISLILIVVMSIAIGLSGCSNSKQVTNKIGDFKVVVKDGWSEINKNIYVFTSSFYQVNMALLTSNKEAVLVDTGMYFDEVQKLQGILKQKKLKLKGIIITHMHGDHNANLSIINTENVPVITPENAQDGQTIKYGKKTLKVVFTEGHYETKGHISVEDVEDNILIAGDIICNNIIPPIAAGGDFLALIDTLNKLKDKNYSLIIPGHGEVVDTSLMFDRNFEYLNNAKAAVEKVISAGGEKKDLESIKLEECIKDISYLFTERLDYWHKTSLEVIYDQLKK